MKPSLLPFFILLLGIGTAQAESDWKKAEKQYKEVVRTASHYPAREFVKAAESGDIKTVTRLLDSGVPVSLRIPPLDEYNGIPPWQQAIHYAAGAGHQQMVRLLLDSGANPNARNSDRTTPLHMTSEPAVARLLLDRGANPSARNDNNEQPIHWAAMEDSSDEVKTLSLVRILIQHGADPLAEDAHGTQPIHNAAANGTVKTVEFFLNQGANPDTPANSKEDYFHNGWTPLHFVGSRYMEPRPEDVGIAKLLINKGADVNTTTRNGEAPLHLVKGVEMTRLLLDQGAVVNIVDHGILKRTPLHHFAMEGDLDSVKLLLTHGANRDAMDGSGETALDAAAFWGRANVVEFLLQQGAKPTQISLTQATRSNDAKVIRLIRSRLRPGTIRPNHRR